MLEIFSKLLTYTVTRCLASRPASLESFSRNRSLFCSAVEHTIYLCTTNVSDLQREYGNIILELHGHSTQDEKKIHTFSIVYFRCYLPTHIRGAFKLQYMISPLRLQFPPPLALWRGEGWGGGSDIMRALPYSISCLFVHETAYLTCTNRSFKGLTNVNVLSVSAHLH